MVWKDGNKGRREDDTQGGETKSARRQDVGEVAVIKDKDCALLTDEGKIKERWREYFNNLLNVENETDPLQEYHQLKVRIGHLRKGSRGGWGWKSQGLKVTVPYISASAGNSILMTSLKEQPGSPVSIYDSLGSFHDHW